MSKKHIENQINEEYYNCESTKEGFVKIWKKYKVVLETFGISQD